MAAVFCLCFHILSVLFTMLLLFALVFILSGKVHILVPRWSLISQFIQKESQEGMGVIYVTGLPISWGS